MKKKRKNKSIVINDVPDGQYMNNERERKTYYKRRSKMWVAKDTQQSRGSVNSPREASYRDKQHKGEREKGVSGRAQQKRKRCNTKRKQQRPTKRERSRYCSPNKEGREKMGRGKKNKELKKKTKKKEQKYNKRIVLVSGRVL